MDKRQRLSKSESFRSKSFKNMKMRATNKKFGRKVRRSLRQKNKISRAITIQKSLKTARRARDIAMILCDKYLPGLSPNQTHSQTIKCCVCNLDPRSMQKQLLLCDYCLYGACHCFECADPPYIAVPDGKFACPQCIEKVITNHHEEYQQLMDQKVSVPKRKSNGALHQSNTSNNSPASIQKPKQHRNTKQLNKSDSDSTITSIANPECSIATHTTNSKGNDMNTNDDLQTLSKRRQSLLQEILNRNSHFMETLSSKSGLECVQRHKDSIGKLQRDEIALNQQITFLTGETMDELQEQIEDYKEEMNENNEQIIHTTKSLAFYKKQVEIHEKELEQLVRDRSRFQRQINAKRRDRQKVKEVEEQQQQISTKDIAEFTEKVIDEALEQFERKSNLWSTHDVISWLNLNGFDDDRFDPLRRAIIKTDICGQFLNQLNRAFLTIIGVDESDANRILQKIKRLKAENQNGQRISNLCIFCAESPINTAVTPCGHQSFCWKCNQERSILKCPVCSGPITDLIQTFMSGF